MTNAIELLVDDHHGVYVPKVFVTNYDMSVWSNVDWDDIETIEKGPEAEWYWEAWQDIIDNATYVHKGHTWYLTQQDGGLFAYCEELMTDTERKVFFGE